jgi:hypothetical protein
MVFLAQNRGMVAKAIPEKVKSQAIRTASADAYAQPTTHQEMRKTLEN